MMESWPSTALVVPEPNLLLEFQVIALDPPPHFCEIDQGTKRHLLVDSREPVLRRFSFALRPLDQQRLFISCCGPLIGAVRTRTRAKRERSSVLVPSRHVTVRQQCFGSLSANVFTLWRAPSAPFLHTLRTMIVGMIAATYLSPRAVTPMRNAELDP